jgi:hypothetical protein
MMMTCIGRYGGVVNTLALSTLASRLIPIK